MAVTGMSHVFGREGMKGGQETVKAKQRKGVEGTVKGGRHYFPFQLSWTSTVAVEKDNMWTRLVASAALSLIQGFGEHIGRDQTFLYITTGFLCIAKVVYQSMLTKSESASQHHRQGVATIRFEAIATNHGHLA